MRSVLSWTTRKQRLEAEAEAQRAAAAKHNEQALAERTAAREDLVNGFYQSPFGQFFDKNVKHGLHRALEEMGRTNPSDTEAMSAVWHKYQAYNKINTIIENIMMDFKKQ